MIRRMLQRSWAVLALILAWQIWVMSTNYNSIVVVSPLSVARDLALHTREYILPALWTTGFALGGLVLGMTAGVLIAVACWSSRILGGLLQSASLVLIATPVVCIIPLLARIFGYAMKTEMLTVAIMTFFPSFVYAGSGLRKLPRRSAEYFHSLAASRWRKLTLLALPAAVPELSVALRVGTAYSVLVTVVAEFLMQTGGLGNMFAITMQQFNLRRALGASVIAMVLSTVLYESASSIEKRLRLRFC